MDRIAWMQIFVRAVETNSFSAVAREMQTTQPTISKQIAALEKYLGVQLLIRSTTKLTLTEEGTRYYQYCQQILATVAEAETSMMGKEKASGILRLGCSVLFGQMQIVPRLKAFMHRYPDVKVDLMMVDHFVNLVEEGLDLVIRIGNLQDNSIIFHRLGTTRRVTVATTTYFEQAGEPKTPDELINHNCIVYTRLSTGNEWHFQGADGIVKVRVKGCFQTNSSVAIRAAVLSGLGIAVAPVWMFGEDIYRGKLQVVLQDYQPTTLPIHAIYRRSCFHQAKVSCFIDFLAEEFKLDPWVSDYGQ
ncbi:MAG: LysR family transcriptional regulator [Gomphosphaeria aponina SAG 52.96 = DSM 107014]|uniref:LysR family transcriptional regulator n=1 Tax=Gomphosphaeria aponina SAG 52.96 = DSM 107014 TaxID=1521640 RepID=A0A941JUS7_9CHRO|nr:LysR family transcriptional regulator [Gomphosphaeria aponina SAG 52.96 = DSM 107014]